MSKALENITERKIIGVVKLTVGDKVPDGAELVNIESSNIIDHPLKKPKYETEHTLTYVLYEDVENDSAMQRLRYQNSALIKALRFYADFENWDSDKTDAGISAATKNRCHDIALYDFDRNLNGKDYAGKRARQCLRDIKR